MNWGRRKNTRDKRIRLEEKTFNPVDLAISISDFQIQCAVASQDRPVKHCAVAAAPVGRNPSRLIAR
jgi:hypothetical protein